MHNKLLAKVAELGHDLNLDGLQVLVKGASMYYTVEGNQLRTPVGVVPLDVTKILKVKIAAAPTSLEDLTVGQIEDYLEQNGFGIYPL